MATHFLRLSTKVDATGKSEILIRFTHGQIDQRAKTNIFIQSDYLDSEIQQIIIPNFRILSNEKKQLKEYLTTQSDKLNALISIIHSTFNDADKKDIAADWLKTTIDKHNFPEKYAPKEETPQIVTLFQFIEKFIKEAPERKDKVTGRQFTKNIIVQYKATYKRLKEFAATDNKSDFDFTEVDVSFYDMFVTYLQSLNLTLNSVGKHIKVLKTMLIAAAKQGYNANIYYKDFHVFTEEIDNIYLNENELQKIKDADFSKTLYLDRVRDWFLLLAWTGCRFSDLEKITKADIKNGFISFRQQKTNNKVTIPLHPVVVEILEKYGYNLPAVITNQKFNDYIKEVCRIAEINSPETTTRTEGGKLITSTFEKWEHVTSHTGRRSFCTNMYKRGVQSLTIMSISGHKTEKSFLKYIKVKQEEHAELMKKAWDKMYK